MAIPINGSETLVYYDTGTSGVYLLRSRNLYYLPERNKAFFCQIHRHLSNQDAEQQERFYTVEPVTNFDGINSVDKNIVKEAKIPKHLADKINNYIVDTTKNLQDFNDFDTTEMLQYYEQLELRKQNKDEEGAKQVEELIFMAAGGEEHFKKVMEKHETLEELSESLGAEFQAFCIQNHIDTLT